MFVVAAQPPAIALTGNPMIWKLRAFDPDSNLFMWHGSRAMLTSLGYIDVPAGDTFTLSWQEPSGANYEQVFISAATPSALNAFPDDDSGYGTNLAYWEAVAAKIQAHPAISPAFLVYAEDTGSGIRLTVEVREYEPGWSVSIDDAGLSGAFAVSTAVPSTNAPDNYKLFLDVVVEDTYQAGDYAVRATLEGIPDGNSEVAFDISEVLHKTLQQLQPEPPVPAWGTDAPYVLDSLRNYYVRIWETADDVAYDSEIIHFPAIGTLTHTPKLAMLGGIAQNLNAAYDFYDNLDENNSLLTWYPDKKTVGTAQPEYLPFINYTGDDLIFYVEVTRYFDDGTNSIVNRYTDYNLTLGPWQTAIIPVGFGQLGLDPDAGIEKYTVQVRYKDFDIVPLPEGESYSPIRTYYVDDAYYKEQRYLMYLNSFYAPQVLRCLGNLDEELSVSRQETRHILPPNYNFAFSEIRQYGTEWTELFTFNSGWITRLEARALQELLIYDYLYEISPYGYIPLYLLSESFPITSTRNTLHSIVLKTKPALLTKFYSNILIPLSPEQEAWLTDLEEYWQTALALPWETP